mgnify:FL=1
MSSPIFICILGAPGLIGRRHTEHCLLDPDVVLSCIVDPTPVGPDFAEEHGLRLFKSLEEMLQARTEGSVQVDGAILATPNATHVPLGIQLVEAGIHILVEVRELHSNISAMLTSWLCAETDGYIHRERASACRRGEAGWRAGSCGAAPTFRELFR